MDAFGDMPNDLPMLSWAGYAVAVANAHPNGATPWRRADYIRKFETMTDGLITPEESRRFLQACEELPRLKAGELHRLNVAMPEGTVQKGKPGIF